MSSDETRADETQSNASKKTAGRSLEDGLFERVREWTDVFPWLRLVRVLRLAGSPPHLFLTAVFVGVWLAVLSNQLGLTTTGNLTLFSFPLSVFYLGGDISWWQRLFATAWTILVLAPICLILTRQGAMLTAGRSMEGLSSILQHALKRTPRAWIAALVPVLCSAVIALPILVLGWLSNLLGEVAAIQWLIVICVLPFAIFCGLLLFGALPAVPLSWAAIANEKNPDPLDSLSRGYEYFLRRPLHLAGYLLVAMLPCYVINYIAEGIMLAGMGASNAMLGVSGSSISLIQKMDWALIWIPAVIGVTLGGGLLGGIYLLLRYDAGGQEVEDIWVPPLQTEPPLPSLPKK